jgi:protocatechuate 3,4-dioxygenase beta subunit
MRRFPLTRRLAPPAHRAWLALALALSSLAVTIDSHAGVDARPLPPQVAQVTAGQTRDTIGSPVGSALLAGVVVTDEQEGRAVRRATVELIGSGIRSVRRTVTDDRGAYSFDGLGPGRYSIVVSKAGFVRSYHGSRRPWRSPGLPIDLSAGEQRADLRTVIQRGGVITGRVFDEQGAPMAGVGFQVFERRSTGSGTQLVRVGVQSSNTDDRGEFRVYGLAPGSYLVAAMAAPQTAGASARVVTAAELQWASAQLQGGAGAGAARGAGSGGDTGPERGPSVSYSRLYYPGTPDPSGAGVIVVEPGQERSGIDIALRLMPVARLTGTMLLPDGTPMGTGVSLNLRRQGADAAEQSGSPSLRIMPRGLFEIPAVEPGAYVMSARASSAPPPQPPQPGMPPAAPVRREMDLWAELEIGVDGRDQDGLVLRFQPGMTVSGRVVSGGLDPALIARVGLLPVPGVPTLGGGVSAQATNGVFRLTGVGPGTYTLTAGLQAVPGSSPAGRWMAESAIWNGKDLFDEPLVVRPGEHPDGVVITFTDQVPELTGRILDGEGRPVTEFFVVVFAAEPERWRPGSRRVRQPVRPQPDGYFRFADLPPGEYILAALADYDPQDIYDPGFLQQVAQSGIRITLGPGEKKSQDIRVK